MQAYRQSNFCRKEFARKKVEAVASRKEKMRPGGRSLLWEWWAAMG
jgi:hypothetical protein